LQHKNTLGIQLGDQVVAIGFTLELPVLTRGHARAEQSCADSIGGKQRLVLQIAARLKVSVGGKSAYGELRRPPIEKAGARLLGDQALHPYASPKSQAADTKIVGDLTRALPL